MKYIKMNYNLKEDIRNMKNIDSIKKNYIYISITLLMLALYVIFFPCISDVLNKLSPELTQCVYLKITGKPCPLCGGTRYIRNIRNVFKDINYIFNPFGMIVICVIFEITFRIYYIIRRNKLNLRNIFIFDIIIHTLMIIAFITYEILFLYNT